MQKRMRLFIFLGLVTTSLIACTTTGPGATPTLPPTEAITTAPPPTPETTEAATAEATAEATVPSADDFVNGLKSAVAARDFTALQSYMADPFTVGYWLSEGVQSSPAEAAALFESSFLPEDAQIIWDDGETDLSQLLQGQLPDTFLPPGKELATALLSYGWGPDAAGEAILFITEQPAGTFQWELMLYSGFGFAGIPTEVQAVVINADEATFYSGPGEEFEPVATVFGGFSYPVIGSSQDGAWWHLRCFEDNNILIPQCWVSADPAISSPATPP
jgi:hypothetical protein